MEMAHLNKSLYSINWPVCITETEYVYCAVRTEPTYNSG